ncbi:hypothetical protein DLAC_09501 [Tieghemostelium lacteum]|uniref:SH3 domain-containing protein n=1 Tax=Tieghemostelium lacteum TaxID=361077 RepID=A0A151Z6H2_TIELA|nr:hypothetical protein DLAC_09501 [Tieghemostelium lacteum]|eukprot:KYQ89552.1 hypothetical protein DLAC_09501 [Tieghemostelium lacteum]
MSDGWKSFKTGFARTKHKVLEKFGATEATVDTRIKEESEKLFVLFKLVKRLKKNVAKYEDILKNIIILQNEMAQDILSFKDNDPTFIAYQECQKNIERERQRVTDQLEIYYHDPLRNYCAQFREIRSRISELEQRRLDMDRYHRDYTIKANKGKDSTSLAKTEGKHQKTKDGYQSLLNELLQDMELLFNDRKEAFDPVFANFINRNAELFEQASQSYRNILNYVAGINEYDGANHKWVITGSETSAMNKNIRSNSVFTQNPKDFTPSNSPPTRARASTIATTSPTRDFGEPQPYQPPQPQEQPLPEYQPPPQQQPAYTLPPNSNGVSLNKSNSPPFQPIYPQPPTAKFQQMNINQNNTTSYDDSSLPVQDNTNTNRIQQRKSMYVPNSGPNNFSSPPQFKQQPQFKPSPQQLKPSPQQQQQQQPQFKPKPQPQQFKTPAATAPPSGRPLPKPAALKKGEALYDFTGLDSKELNFSKGDIISFTKTTGDWYEGELNGVRGLVPSNYVKLL